MEILDGLIFLIHSLVRPTFDACIFLVFLLDFRNLSQFVVSHFCQGLCVRAFQPKMSQANQSTLCNNHKLWPCRQSAFYTDFYFVKLQIAKSRITFVEPTESIKTFSKWGKRFFLSSHVTWSCLMFLKGVTNHDETQ